MVERARSVLSRTHQKLALGGLVLAAVAAIGLWSQAPFPGALQPAQAAGSAPPNIVVIQTDDEALSQFTRKVMPNTKRLLADRGAVFNDYIVTTSQCCPSRASLLTGQYAHNHGVLSNSPGYPALNDKENVLPVWLQQAGYYTMHVGKYLNNYERFADPPSAVAPGWDQWYTIFGSTLYYDYKYAVNGALVHHGHRPGDNATHVLDRDAVGLINTYAPKQKPFYLQLDERAPHVSTSHDPFGNCRRSAFPLKRDENAFKNDPTLSKATLPRPPSFNEDDMSDKPAFLSGVPKLSSNDRRIIKKQWGCALEALQGVDRTVAKIYAAVKQSGDLPRTVFVFISDNGLFYGQHRIAYGKVLPYGEALHLPLVIKAPRRYIGDASPHREIGRPVANIDLAPTILDFAGGSPCPPDGGGSCRTMDGRSLMPLLARTSGWPDGRGLLTEYSATKAGRYATCQFAGIRTKRQSYVEHSRTVDPSTGDCVNTDQRERYDLTADPYELHNLCFGGEPFSCPVDPTQVRLEQRLSELRNCSGIRGRDPLGPNHDYCE
jgi:arylsulfatase A-like enzyme